MSHGAAAAQGRYAHTTEYPLSMTNSENAPALWRQLTATMHVLLAVDQGQSGSVALDRTPPELRSGVQALAFHAWRNLGYARAICKLLVKRPPPPETYTLLCLALTLCRASTSEMYDAFTLVNQTVEAAKRSPVTRAQANFINACLRRYLREHDALDKAVAHDLEARWNHPAWWVKRLQREYPLAWESVLEAANQQPPMTLRINLRKTDMTHYLGLLQGANIEFSEADQVGVSLVHPVAVQRLPGFDQGLVSVQDAAAQKAVPLLLGSVGPNSGHTERFRVLDACAAPGGKTAHLLEFSDAAVWALDIDAERVQRIQQTLCRLDLHAKVCCADAADVGTWWDGTPFDYILLDAPCTASGIVRRHPDIRWLRRESDIAQLVSQQKHLLGQLWTVLRPGGRMLYSTCSVFKAEGQDQLATFLADNNDAQLMPSPGHLLPGRGATECVLEDNSLRDHDGFFYALFEKTHT